MDNKKLWIGTVVLAAAAAATLLIDKSGAPERDARSGKTVIDGLDLAAVDKVSLKKDDRALVIVRAPDKTWHLENDKGFPADAARLARLFDDLGRARVESVVTTKKEALATFGLDKPAVVTFGAGGKDALVLALGDARAKGGQYVAFGGEAKAYLVGQNLAAAPDADAWEHKQLLALDKGAVKAIAFTPVTGKPVTLSREKKEDKLKAEGLAANESEDPSVAGAEAFAQNVTFSKRYDKSNEQAKSALASPAKALITTFDGKAYQFQVGSVGEKHFLVVGGTPELDALNASSYFEVPQYVAQQFAKQRSDFIKEPSAGH